MQNLFSVLNAERGFRFQTFVQSGCFNMFRRTLLLPLRMWGSRLKARSAFGGLYSLREKGDKVADQCKTHRKKFSFVRLVTVSALFFLSRKSGGISHKKGIWRLVSSLVNKRRKGDFLGRACDWTKISTRKNKDEVEVRDCDFYWWKCEKYKQSARTYSTCFILGFVLVIIPPK